MKAFIDSMMASFTFRVGQLWLEQDEIPEDFFSFFSQEVRLEVALISPSMVIQQQQKNY